MENKTFNFILIAVVATAVVTGATFQFKSYLSDLQDRAAKVEQAELDLKYHVEAEKINDYYSRFGITTRTKVIRQTLEAIDRLLPKYFQEGQFSRNDFIAIAMVESNFNQYLVGKYKEFGIFQLLPESATWAGVKRNQFDIDVNTEMAMFVLQKKYQQQKNYKMSVIAYNGVVKTSKGKVSEEYWNKFIKARNAIDDILGDTSLPNK